MPVAEFEENSLRFAEDYKGLHKTFRSQKLTFWEIFSKLVDETQFEALLQTQATGVRLYRAGENIAYSTVIIPCC